MTSKRDELNSKISSTSGELANYQAQLDRAKAAEEALKLAQNDKISGSVKSEASKPSNSTNTTNNANKQIQQQTVRLIKIKITPLIIPATILPTQATTPKCIYNGCRIISGNPSM